MLEIQKTGEQQKVTYSDVVEIEQHHEFIKEARESLTELMEELFVGDIRNRMGFLQNQITHFSEQLDSQTRVIHGQASSIGTKVRNQLSEVIIPELTEVKRPIVSKLGELERLVEELGIAFMIKVGEIQEQNKSLHQSVSTIDEGFHEASASIASTAENVGKVSSQIENGVPEGLEELRQKLVTELKHETQNLAEQYRLERDVILSHVGEMKARNHRTNTVWGVVSAAQFVLVAVVLFKLYQ